jgi:hypothetical protein
MENLEQTALQIVMYSFKASAYERGADSLAIWCGTDDAYCFDIEDMSSSLALVECAFGLSKFMFLYDPFKQCPSHQEKTFIIRLESPAGYNIRSSYQKKLGVSERETERLCRTDASL